MAASPAMCKDPVTAVRYVQCKPRHLMCDLTKARMLSITMKS